MRKQVLYLCFVASCFVFPLSVRAAYVLPYPSYMPGNKLYRISRIIDTLKRYWYFGNIAQIKYHMQLSDKYLIEAKTLMEYQQYLLGSDALLRSDKEFMQLPAYVQRVKAEHVDVTIYKQFIREEGMKHEEILSSLIQAIPKEFTWTPEKATATHLNLNEMVGHSIDLRMNIMNTIFQ